MTTGSGGFLHLSWTDSYDTLENVSKKGSKRTMCPMMSAPRIPLSPSKFSRELLYQKKFAAIIFLDSN